MEEKIAIINDKVDSIQVGVNRIDKDLDNDRQNLQQIRITQETLIAQVDELRKHLNHLLDKTHDKVAEAIAPLQEQINDKYKKPTLFDKLKLKLKRG